MIHFGKKIKFFLNLICVSGGLYACLVLNGKNLGSKTVARLDIPKSYSSICTYLVNITG